MMGKSYRMRNQEWHTGQSIVPHHLQPKLELANEELRAASELLNNADRRHAEAVLARIAVASETAIEELRVAKELLNSAGKRYAEAVSQRTAISDEINQFVRTHEHYSSAS